MRIATANTYDNALEQLYKRQSELSQQQERVSTGQRVNRPSDDPAAAGTTALTAPNGLRIHLVAADPPMRVPPRKARRSAVKPRVPSSIAPLTKHERIASSRSWRPGFLIAASAEPRRTPATGVSAPGASRLTGIGELGSDQHAVALLELLARTAGARIVAADLGELAAGRRHRRTRHRLRRIQRAAFQRLNGDYTAKHGFPFIIAVRDNTKTSILQAFQTRLAQDTEQEFIIACAQVERIAELRLKDQLP